MKKTSPTGPLTAPPTSEYPDWLLHVNNGLEEHMEIDKRLLIGLDNKIPTSEDRVRQAFMFGVFCEAEYSMKKAWWIGNRHKKATECFWAGFYKGIVQGGIAAIFIVILYFIYTAFRHFL